MTIITQSLNALQAVVLTADDEAFDPNIVSPGPGGFLVIAFLAVVLFFLGFDLVRRLRRIKYRDEIRTELAAEIAELEANKDSADEAGDSSDTK